MTTVLIVSDTHINGTTSLCKPGCEKDDGGNYNLSRGQWWLWENWVRLVELAEQAAHSLEMLVDDLKITLSKRDEKIIKLEARVNILEEALRANNIPIPENGH